MSRVAWADVAGKMEETLALSLPATKGDVGRVIGSTRDSLYIAVLEMFVDPRCSEETKTLVREYVTGLPIPT